MTRSRSRTQSTPRARPAAIGSTRPAPDPSQSTDPTLTGVARGSLGTGANLEETQVLRTEELRAAAAAAENPEPKALDHAPPMATVPAPLEAATPAGYASMESLPKAPPVVAAARRERVRRGAPNRFAGLAGVLAVVLVVLVGVAVLTTRDGGLAGSGTDPGAAATPTAEPAATEADGGGGDGKNDGKGKGKGKGNGGGGGGGD